MIDTQKQPDNNFIINDFKEMSAKLEDTDKKTHMCIQTFCALVGVIAGIIVTKLIEMEWSEIIRKSNILLVVTFMICCIGEFNFCFLLSSQLVQNEYLRRINRLRAILLIDSGRKEEFLKSYGYLTAKPPRLFGMGSLFIYFVWLVVLIFAIGSWYLAEISKRPVFAMVSKMLLFVFLLINIRRLKHAQRLMQQSCRAENLMIEDYLMQHGIALPLDDLSQNNYEKRPKQ